MDKKIKLNLLIHDLKGPLSVVETGINTLLDKPDIGPLTGKQHKVLRRILRNTKLAQTLVNDTLEIDRPSQAACNTRAIPLSKVVTAALKEICDITSTHMSESIHTDQDLDRMKQILQHAAIDLIVEAELWDAVFAISANRLQQILRNLLSNAIKYRRKKIELGFSLVQDNLCFYVKDDGKGIPSHLHEKIFKCYFQLNDCAEATVRCHGLGLAGVQILVEDLNGTLKLESDVDHGATFRVELPVSIGKI